MIFIAHIEVELEAEDMAQAEDIVDMIVREARVTPLVDDAWIGSIEQYTE